VLGLLPGDARIGRAVNAGNLIGSRLPGLAGQLLAHESHRPWREDVLVSHIPGLQPHRAFAREQGKD
jgi:hypothetical protein